MTLFLSGLTFGAGQGIGIALGITATVGVALIIYRLIVTGRFPGIG